MNERIPRPTEQERRRAIQTIVARGLVRPRRRPPLGVLFFGVEDSALLAGLIFGLCLLPAAGAAQILPGAAALPGEPPPMAGLVPILFLLSPVLYAALQVLTAWKETAQGTLEWKRCCRISHRELLAWRTLVFGGVSAAACLPADLLLWQAAGRESSLLWMLGTSLASLFLYAALTLAWRNRPPAAPLLLWGALGAVLAVWKPGAALLYRAPALLLLAAAAGSAAYSVSRLVQTEKGACYGIVR